MDVENYLRKFSLLLEYSLEGKLVINENNMEIILKFLKDRNENSPGKLLLSTAGFYDLIFRSVEKMYEASIPLKVFLIKILTILYKNETQFTKMQMQGLNTKVCVLDNFNCSPPPKLHLACIELATVQLNFELGYMIQHKVWKYIFCPKIHHKLKDVSDAAYNFIAKLVWKLNENNLELELQEVLGYIVEPILSSEYLSVPVLDTKTDAALSDKIFPHLSALLAVTTESDNHACVDKVRVLLKKYFIIDHRLFDIFNTTKSSNLLKLLNSCLFRYYLLIYRHLLFSQRTDEFCSRMTVFHRNYIGQATKKRDAFLIVDYVTQSTIIWSHFEKAHATRLNLPLTFERNGLNLEFSLQIAVHLIMPMVKYSALYRIVHKIELSDEIDLYIRKMTRTLADYIYSSCYLLGTLLEDGCPTFRKKLTTYTLKELLRLKGHITQSQAGPLFQSLYYLLEVFITCDGPDVVVTHENRLDMDDLAMLSHLLNAMKMLLKEHNIPWYENLEVVCVQSNLLSLLKLNMLTMKHVVQVLDLVNICIMKFLSPNMSLLIEGKRSQETTLNEIGNVIKLYMQHDDWEVRDSAMNILKTCTEISFIKYIPLQTLITESNLITLAAQAALTDSEMYTQCTALKCLTAATKIHSLWQEVLADNENINLHLIHILKNHDEGMVRKEAAKVLIGVFANQKVTPMFQSTLYEVMLSAALDDLHWEVQLAALCFWKRAINNYLTYRGMLDGKFPPVTFSKEKRKIVVLDNAEIQRQLTAIMNHLSSIGCLTVLLECMNELHSIMVNDQAYCIAKDLIQMLDKYNFKNLKECDNVEPVDELIQNKQADNTPSPLSSATSEEEKYKVIDSVLSANQTELITNLCDKYSQRKPEVMDVDLEYCTRRKLAYPNKFLEYFRGNDYSSIKERKRYNNNDYVCTLDQSLDEVLDV